LSQKKRNLLSNREIAFDPVSCKTWGKGRRAEDGKVLDGTIQVAFFSFPFLLPTGCD